jgi:hypothetical protein
MSLKLPLHRCLAGLLVFMICALADCGWALEAVNGPVVLSLSGNVLEKNTPRALILIFSLLKNCLSIPSPPTRPGINTR